MSKFINSAKDTFKDGMEKASTASSRAGNVVKRVAKLSEAKVDKEVIALQMTKNSKNGHHYSPEFVESLCHLYEDSKSNKSVLSEKQTTALIDDQVKSEKSEVEPDAPLLPAF